MDGVGISCRDTVRKLLPSQPSGFGMVLSGSPLPILERLWQHQGHCNMAVGEKEFMKLQKADWLPALVSRVRNGSVMACVTAAAFIRWVTDPKGYPLCGTQSLNGRFFSRQELLRLTTGAVFQENTQSSSKELLAGIGLGVRPH